MTFGPTYAVSLESLGHHRNVASLSLFYSFYFGKFLSELAELFPHTYSHGRFMYCSNKLPDFSVTILRSYKHVYVSSFFPHTARIWNFLHAECSPLSNDLKSFKFIVKRHLFLGSLRQSLFHSPFSYKLKQKMLR